MGLVLGPDTIMRNFCGSIVFVWPLVFCLLQGSFAKPNPDFGIDGSISSTRNDVTSEASSIANYLAQMDDMFDLNLDSGYVLLGNVKAAIVTIGTGVQTAGNTLMDSLRALAVDRGPAVGSAFTPVYDAIDALRLLTRTGLRQQLRQLSRVTGAVYISRQFRDTFRLLRDTLDKLKVDLQDLQHQVELARAVYTGPGAIPASVVRINVLSKTQNNIRIGLTSMRVSVQTVLYVVQSTLSGLSEANDFLNAVVAEAQSNAADYQAVELHEFQQRVRRRLRRTVRSVKNTFVTVVERELSALTPITEQLVQLNILPAMLEGALTTLLEVFSSSYAENRVQAYDTQFSQYISTALALEADEETFLQTTTCPAVQGSIQGRVAAGPYNEYCFIKYSSWVYTVYSQYRFTAAQCYDTEAGRLRSLFQVFTTLVDMLLFNVEDLAPGLGVCVAMSNGASDCVTTLGEFYVQLALIVPGQIENMQQLVTVELQSSVQRLGACVTSTRQLTLSELESLVSQQQRCFELGLNRNDPKEAIEGNDSSV